MSNRIGFGGGVPKEEVYNKALVTIPPKPKYRFGQSTIDKLHVRHIPPAKILISVRRSEHREWSTCRLTFLFLLPTFKPVSLSSPDSPLV
jgi:hypothetical protein